MTKDNINPGHYKTHPSGVECIEVIYPLRFDEGAAIKYLWRLGNKDEDLQELEKAAWYVKHAIAMDIKTEGYMIPYSCVQAFHKWNDAEPDGFRGEAICDIFLGRFPQALGNIYKWIAEIKGIDVKDVVTPDPQIGSPAQKTVE